MYLLTRSTQIATPRYEQWDNLLTTLNYLSRHLQLQDVYAWFLIGPVFSFFTGQPSFD